ncbi:MAG: histidine kinase dimerization/phospho-acceptor domain-containing protein, partial [Xanthobacteraceae bacterium]
MLNQKLLFDAIDWFVPEALRTDTATMWRARIFAITHLLGPCLAVLILCYLYQADPDPGIPFWTICSLCFAFPMLPFAMKVTKRLSWVALFSVCDLTFVSVFGSFFYGGVSSPFLPWFLTALLLGFFYLAERPFVVLGIFAVNLVGFCAAYAVTGAFPELVPVAALSTVGVVSVCAATLYTSMMAVYYASVITAESGLRQEVERHLVTAARMRKTKEQADRANEAKAVFLAKMSHQLRTPLNAVIGYSEILLEDLPSDGGEQRRSDLQRINNAGKHLLSLVTEVLDISKIERNATDVKVEKFDVAALINEIMATCDSLAKVKKNKLVLIVEPGIGTIDNDPVKFRQILLNLL